MSTKNPTPTPAEQENAVSVTEPVTVASPLAVQPDAERAPWCSFVPSTAAEKARLYHAMTNPDNAINNCINMEIDLVDVFIEWQEMTNQDGEIGMVPRCVLFSADGKTYASASRGIYNALVRLSMVYGMPHWDEPIRVRFIQVQRGERRFYTLDVVG